MGHVLVIQVLVTVLLAENAFFLGMIYKEKALRKVQPKP